MRQTNSSMRSICLTCVMIGIVAAPAGAVTRTWDGGAGTDRWSHGANWNPDGVPQDTDDVSIFTTDDIQMDLGTPTSRYTIASLTAYGSVGGSLTILANKGLEIHGDFKSVGLSQPTWDLTMEEHSRLELRDEGGDADLVRINVTMELVTSGAPTELHVDGAIERGDFDVNEGCIVTVGTGTAPEWNELSGEWKISDGGEVTFENNTGTYEGEALHMTLAGGSTVTYRIAYYGGGTFASAAEHELLYDEGDNILHVGDGEEYLALDLGYYTVVKRLATEASLRVSLLCKTAIRSYFGYEVVRDAWDTRNVDIWGEWIDASVWWAGSLRYEMISTNFEDWFTGAPVIFLDVPCLGTWRDLYLEDATAEAVVVPISDEWNNTMTDGAMGAGFGTTGDEVGLFRDVYIGAQRGLRFYPGQAKLYYYGTRTIDRTGKVFLHYEEVHGDDIDELIIRAVGTIYGDWNGDCAITNVELAALEEAIAGGEETYDPLMDYDCDGQLTTEVELAAMVGNMTAQPPCGRGGGDGGGESWSESYEGYEDVPGLAAWLIEVLSEEQLEAFVADLAVAAAEFADSPVGQDLAELLCCLQ